MSARGFQRSRIGINPKHPPSRLYLPQQRRCVSSTTDRTIYKNVTGLKL
jgi:hypothetical protein